VSNSELKVTEQDREELRRYLLGQMVEVDLSQVEERLMSEADLYEEILILEDEIIDQYIRGAMSEAESASFERYFLQSPEHRQKLRFARALRKYVDQTVGEPTSDFKAEVIPAKPPLADPAYVDPPNPSPRPRGFWSWPFPAPALNYALAAVAVIAVAGLAWMLIPRPAGPAKVFEATLTPGGLTREGGELQTISIPPGPNTLRVRLILPAGQYEDYKIELFSSNNSPVLTRDQLNSTEEAGKKVLYVDITANLRRDTYKLKLSARSAGAYEGIASYNFQIVPPKSS
jgi:hypothetical protein